MIDIHRVPDAVHIETAEGWVRAAATSGGHFAGSGAQVSVRVQADGSLDTVLESPTVAIARIHLRYQGTVKAPRVLGDAWERGYGDLAWQAVVPERVMPWYMVVQEGGLYFGFGVKTGARSLCYFQLDNGGLSIVMDVRSGDRGVSLGTRVLLMATLVTAQSVDGETAFAFTNRFCTMMCDHPRMPSQPVYGGNNWYYAYGNSSHREIIEDAKRIADWSASNTNRPYMVIDDGWQLRSGGGACNGGPWIGNSRFPDMERLAAEMSELAVRPGIWMRPLLTTEDMPDHWIRSQLPGAFVLDPSVPDVLEYVRQEIRTLADSGYQLIKNDFTSFDIFGEWGFAFGSQIPMRYGAFWDGAKTTAEIIRDLYAAIADASEGTLMMGCNTIGHLSAGLFQIQRTGDDTSGREWERTRKMGVNTLAFRMPQHGTFFSADADCVGLTAQIPWHLNEQWLALLADSGTPLFVSADPSAVGKREERAIRHAFAQASQPLPVAEPLDWMETTCPSQWRLQGRTVQFDWFGEHGVIPAYAK